MSNSKPQWAERLAVFDLETTGINPRTDRIVTAALALLENNKVVERYDWIINPGVQIPAQAVAVHGITNEIAAASGLKPKIGVGQILAQIADVYDRGYVLTAFNASFDLTLLHYEAMRYEFGSLAGIAPVCDPYLLDRKLDKYRRGKRTLTDVCGHYGVSLTAAHDAAADAIAAGHVAYEIATQFASQLPEDPQELHRLQIEWDAELTADRKAYLERIGRQATNLQSGWPLKL